MTLQVVCGKLVWLLTYPYPGHHVTGIRLRGDDKIIHVNGQLMIPALQGATQSVAHEALVSYVHSVPHEVFCRLLVDRDDPRLAIRAEFAESIEKLPPLKPDGDVFEFPSHDLPEKPESVISGHNLPDRGGVP